MFDIIFGWCLLVFWIIGIIFIILIAIDIWKNWDDFWKGGDNRPQETDEYAAFLTTIAACTAANTACF
jgi:hypothetical protein